MKRENIGDLVAAAGEGRSASVALAAYSVRRIQIALFCAGFATFSLLYCVQPLLPEFSREFAVSSAQSSLALSMGTGFLAFSIFLAGPVSEAVGRRGLMFSAMASASILNVLVGASTGWHWILALRSIEGFLLGGVPAVAMAYLAEEIPPRGLGKAMGLYVAGTAFGGMVGRIGVSTLADLSSWRMAMATIGLVDLFVAIAFVIFLPPSRNFTASRGVNIRYHLAAWGEHLRNPSLILLMLIGSLMSGIFMAVLSFIGFHLSDTPYRLSQSEIGLIFSVYLLGMLASSMAGGLSDRFGQATLICVGVLLSFAGLLAIVFAPLWMIITGVVLLTCGFFAVHAVASSSIGIYATRAKAHASSLYLLFYYLGGSLIGPVAGVFWDEAGWLVMVGFLAALLLITAVLVVTLRAHGVRRFRALSVDP